MSGKAVTGNAPPVLLPTPSGVSRREASFNLWPLSDPSHAPQSNHGRSVASFIPENATAPIEVAGKG